MVDQRLDGLGIAPMRELWPIAASNFASALISGDIIVEADDIYGDGVNLAARLEALAEPGGIFVAVLFMMPLVRRPRSIPMSPGH